MSIAPEASREPAAARRGSDPTDPIARARFAPALGRRLITLARRLDAMPKAEMPAMSGYRPSLKPSAWGLEVGFVHQMRALRLSGEIERGLLARGDVSLAVITRDLVGDLRVPWSGCAGWRRARSHHYSTGSRCSSPPRSSRSALRTRLPGLLHREGVVVGEGRGTRPTGVPAPGKTLGMKPDFSCTDSIVPGCLGRSLQPGTGKRLTAGACAAVMRSAASAYRFTSTTMRPRTSPLSRLSASGIASASPTSQPIRPTGQVQVGRQPFARPAGGRRAADTSRTVDAGQRDAARG